MRWWTFFKILLAAFMLFAVFTNLVNLPITMEQTMVVALAALLMDGVVVNGLKK
jgi:hypothetical protein